MKYILTDGVEFTKELLADVWHGTDGVDAKATLFPERNGVLSGYSQNDGIDYFRKPEKDKEYVSSDGSFTSVKEYYQANNGNDFYTYIDEAGYHHIEFKDGITGISDFYDYLEDPDTSGSYDPADTNGRDSILVENSDLSIPKEITIYGNTKINTLSEKIEGVGVFQDAADHYGNYMVPVAVSRRNLFPASYFLYFTESEGWNDNGVEKGNLPGQLKTSDIWQVRKIGEGEYYINVDTTLSQGDPYRSILISKSIPVSDAFCAGYGKYTVVCEVLEGEIEEGRIDFSCACSFGGRAVEVHNFLYAGDRNVKFCRNITEENIMNSQNFPFDGSVNFGIRVGGAAPAQPTNVATKANVRIRVSIIKGDFESVNHPEWSSPIVSNYIKENVSNGTVEQRIARYFINDALYKIGDSCDYLVVPDGKIKRRTKKVSIGPETIITNGDTSGEFHIELLNIKQGGDAILSAYEKANGTLADKQYKVSGNHIIIKDSDFSSGDGLSKFCERCQNLDILYEIEELEEEIIGHIGQIYFDKGDNFLFIKDTYGALENKNIYLSFKPLGDPDYLPNGGTERSKVFGDEITSEDIGIILHYPIYPSKISVNYYRV